MAAALIDVIDSSASFEEKHKAFSQLAVLLEGNAASGVPNGAPARLAARSIRSLVNDSDNRDDAAEADKALVFDQAFKALINGIVCSKGDDWTVRAFGSKILNSFVDEASPKLTKSEVARRGKILLVTLSALLHPTELSGLSGTALSPSSQAFTATPDDSKAIRDVVGHVSAYSVESAAEFAVEIIQLGTPGATTFVTGLLAGQKSPALKKLVAERCAAAGVTAATFPFLWKLQQQGSPAEKLALLSSLLATLDSKQSIDEAKRVLWTLQQIQPLLKEVANSAAQGLLEKAVAVASHVRLHGVDWSDAAVGLPALRLVASLAFVFHNKLDAKIRWAAVAPLYTEQPLKVASLTIPVVEVLAFILSTTFYRHSKPNHRGGQAVASPGSATAASDDAKPADETAAAPAEPKQEAPPAKITEEDFPGAAGIFSSFVAEAQSKLAELISRSLAPIPATATEGEASTAPSSAPLSKEALAEIEAIAKLLSNAEQYFAGRGLENHHGARVKFPAWLGADRERPHQVNENRGEGGSRKRGRENDTGRDDRNGGGWGRGQRDRGHHHSRR